MFFGEGFEKTFSRLDEDDSKIGWVDVSVVRFESAANEVGESAREFNSGGTSANDGDGHEPLLFCGG